MHCFHKRWSSPAMLCRLLGLLLAMPSGTTAVHPDHVNNSAGCRAINLTGVDYCKNVEGLTGILVDKGQEEAVSDGFAKRRSHLEDGQAPHVMNLCGFFDHNFACLSSFIQCSMHKEKVYWHAVCRTHCYKALEWSGGECKRFRSKIEDYCDTYALFDDDPGCLTPEIPPPVEASKAGSILLIIIFAGVGGVAFVGVLLYLKKQATIGRELSEAAALPKGAVRRFDFETEAQKNPTGTVAGGYSDLSEQDASGARFRSAQEASMDMKRKNADKKEEQEDRNAATGTEFELAPAEGVELHVS